ncbi:MAG TPA: hypothetical protein VND99_02505 [Candidatus Acidoferrales bacterium]|nr:hypothetical protein [Candidatus Acidoferrales bacterium]
MTVKHHSKDLIAILYITILAVLAIIWGFSIIPFPGTEKGIISDHKRVIDIGQIRDTIDDYYQNNGQLPQTLSALTYNVDATSPLNTIDPQTNEPYEYMITGQTEYELCATFATSSTRDDPSAYDNTSSDYTTFMDEFKHPAGHFCFHESESSDPLVSPVMPDNINYQISPSPIDSINPSLSPVQIQKGGGGSGGSSL